MSANVNFASTPRNSSGVISAANTNMDGTGGTRVDIFVAGTNGSRIDSVTIKGAPATYSTAYNANIVRLWVYDGSNTWLIHEEALPAATDNGTSVISNEVTIALNLQLPTGYKLQASTHAAQQYHVQAIGGDY